VGLRYPKNPAKSFVMRIVGLPGESLSIAGGVVMIDGRPIPEPYLVQGEAHTYEGSTLTLYPIGNGSWCWDERGPHDTANQEGGSNAGESGFMPIAEAFEIVLALARQNVIDDLEMATEHARQVTACNTVEDFIVNQLGEE
jgi:hypothetical protein